MPNYYKLSSTVHNSVSGDFISDCIKQEVYEFCVNSSKRLANFRLMKPGDVCWTRIKQGKTYNDTDQVWRLDIVSQSAQVQQVKLKDVLMWKHKADCDKIGEDPESYESCMYLTGKWTYEGTFGEMSTLSKSIFNKRAFPRTAIRLDEPISFSRSI